MHNYHIAQVLSNFSDCIICTRRYLALHIHEDSIVFEWSIVICLVHSSEEEIYVVIREYISVLCFEEFMNAVCASWQYESIQEWWFAHTAWAEA